MTVDAKTQMDAVANAAFALQAAHWWVWGNADVTVNTTALQEGNAYIQDMGASVALGDMGRVRMTARALVGVYRTAQDADTSDVLHDLGCVARAVVDACAPHASEPQGAADYGALIAGLIVAAIPAR